MKSKIVIFLLLTCSIWFFSGCDNNEEYVPQYPLNISVPLVYLNQQGIGSTSYLSPNSSGYAVLTIPVANSISQVYTLNDELDPNFKGLLIYKAAINIYIIYDRTCTYLPLTNNCALEPVEEWENLFKCPCCQSEFLLKESGSTIFEGPAHRHLLVYSNSIVDLNLGYLFIQNY